MWYDYNYRDYGSHLVSGCESSISRGLKTEKLGKVKQTILGLESPVSWAIRRIVA